MDLAEQKREQFRREFHCDDYFSSELAKNGYWDEGGQLWLVEPAERLEEKMREAAGTIPE